MATKAWLPAGALLALLLCGCGRPPGWLYTHITQPYEVNFAATPVAGKSCRLVTHRLREPVTRAGFSAEWSADELSRRAREAGIARVHYIDRETLSVLGGVYRRRAYIVYGE
jgi:hypothetical protein